MTGIRALLLLAVAAPAPLPAAETARPLPPVAQLTTPGWSYAELRRFKAPEALPPALERFGVATAHRAERSDRGGYLYVTGHDNTELYVPEFPEAGSVMRWIATVPIPSEGQAFGRDPEEPGVFYSILKRTREVIAGRVTWPQP